MSDPGMDEPKKLYSVIRDRDGELWMRGRKWWYWQPQRGDGEGGPGKLAWRELTRMYGPFSVDRETERIAALGVLGGRARD